MANLDVSMRLKLVNELSRPAKAAKEDIKQIVDAARALDKTRGGDGLAKGLKQAGTAADRLERELAGVVKSAYGMERARPAKGLEKGLKDTGRAAQDAKRGLEGVTKAADRIPRDERGRFLAKGLRDVEGAAKGAQRELAGVERRAEGARRSLLQLYRERLKAIGGGPDQAGGGGMSGMAPMAMLGPYLAPAALGAGVLKTFGSAMSIEKSLAEVRKFYDLNDAELADMKREIFGMVQELGKAPEAIAAIYARAGQQGVARDQVREYARDVAKIAVAWDMTEEASANGLGTLKSALGIDQPALVKLAGTINTLADGMEGPVAESDLLEYLARVAGTAKSLNASAKAAVSMGAALRSAGEQPEIAATTYNTILTKLATADRGSKDALAGYEELGFDPKTFSAQMQKNADAGMMTFFERIRKLQGEGKNVIGPIADIFGTEYSDNILKFVNVLDVYKKALAMVESDEAGVASLDRSYKIQSSTTSAQAERLKAMLAMTADAQASGYLDNVKQGLQAVGDELERIRTQGSVFDDLAAGAQGFAKGLGYENAGKALEDAGRQLRELLQPKETPAARQAGIFEGARQAAAGLKEDLEYIRDLYDSLFGEKNVAAVARDRINQKFDDTTVAMNRMAASKGLSSPEGYIRRMAMGEERYRAAEQRADAANQAKAPPQLPAAPEANRRAAVEALKGQLAARAGAMASAPAKVPVEPDVKFDMTAKARIEGAFSVPLGQAAQSSMQSYTSGLEASGSQAVGAAEQIAARIKAALDITLTPTISPRFVPPAGMGGGGGAPAAGGAAGKQSSLARPSGAKVAGLGGVSVTNHFHGANATQMARAAMREQNRAIRGSQGRALHDMGSATA